MLPSAVLTQVKATHLAALGPEPVTIGKWSQPASLTAVQQDRPSVTTLQPAARSRLASVAISFLRKPLTTVSRSRLGLRSAVVSTAATNGVLPAAPRPRLPPQRWPPKEASSPSTRPAGLGFPASRVAIAAISLCLSSHAVGCRVPSRRDSSTDDIPPLLWVRW